MQFGDSTIASRQDESQFCERMVYSFLYKIPSVVASKKLQFNLEGFPWKNL